MDVITTYLEMLIPPPAPPRPLPAPCQIIRANPPTLSFYRYLYGAVGEGYEWVDRWQLDNLALGEIVMDTAVAVHVLYHCGTPAGYAELDYRQESEVELAYFGLLPEFVGRGLGRPLLDWAIQTAWQSNPRRVWLHTCSLDHPNALPVYQQAGFTIYRVDGRQ